MSRTFHRLALLISLLLTLPAAAQEPPVAYTLGLGDTLAVTVFGRPDLSGQFVIGPDAAIRLPLVGSVPAAGRSREAMEQELAEKLAKLLDYHAEVTVDVAIYQPIFVIGDVTTPGEHVFLPGMTALKAFARAGGTPTLYQTPDSVAVDSVAADRDMRLARTDLYAGLLRRAAADAALAGASEITLPAELEPVAQAPMIRDMLDRQNALLESERVDLQEMDLLVQRQQVQLDEEIAALQGERTALQEQARVIGKELANIQDLAKRGLTTSSRLLELQQLKSAIEGDSQRLAALLSRARQRQVELEMDLHRRVEEIRRERHMERIALAAEIERARARLEGARLQLSALGQVSVADVAYGYTEPSFRITRGGAVIAAKGETLLQPGDVVDVRLIPSDGTLQPARSSSTAPLPVTPAALR